MKDTEQSGEPRLNPGSDPEAPTLADGSGDVSNLLSLVDTSAIPSAGPGADGRTRAAQPGGESTGAPGPGPTATPASRPGKRASTRERRRGSAGRGGPGEPDQTLGVRIEPGARLGHYVLLNQIGAGGMATIFRARDVRNDRIVAVKALHAHQAKTLAGKRFKREYRAIRRLAHPNIVQVFEYGVENDQPFIVMEYVEGEDLKAHLRKLWTLPPEEQWPRIEDLVVQICQALEEVHGRGIIHRDLKPSNILLTPERQAKLTDFGVAKPEDVSVQLTQAGMLVGTVAYLAPEVFEQAPLDHRIDLYALGIMLYVMLAHKLPFSGKNIAEIMEKHLAHAPVPPSKLNPDVPDHLERITMKLLEKSPGDRFQSAAAVLRALRRNRSGGRIEAPVEFRNRDLYWQPRLVGRTAALQKILDLVSELMQGHGGVLLVEGNEGTGKSRLVETGLAVAQPRGIGVYSGACLEGPQGWGEGLRDIIASVEAEAHRTHIALPALERLASCCGRSDVPVPSSTPESGSEYLEDDLVATFRDLTRKSPRVAWVDDVDRADPGTVAGLVGLASRVVAEGAPLLLVMTAQQGDSGLPADLTQVVDGAIPKVSVHRTRLDNLYYNEVVDLLEFMYPADSRIGALGKRLYEETRGNPLLLTDVLRYLVTRGKLARRTENGKCRWTMAMSTDEIADMLAIPKGLNKVLSERLRVYPAQTRTLLRLFATWGRTVSFRSLLQLTSASEEALLAHIERLLMDGWLAEDWLGGEERYRLAHPAYRRLLLNQVSPANRAKLRAFIDGKLAHQSGRPT